MTIKDRETQIKRYSIALCRFKRYKQCMTSDRQLDGDRIREFVADSGMRPEEVCVKIDASMSILRGMFKGHVPKRRSNRILQSLAQLMGLPNFGELIKTQAARETA